MRVIKIFIGIMVLVILVAVVVIGYSTCAGGNVIQRIDKSEPDKSVAPYKVATKTKTYLAEYAQLNDDKSVTMSGWYQRESDKWVRHEEPITLPPVLHPVILQRG